MNVRLVLISGFLLALGTILPPAALRAESAVDLAQLNNQVDAAHMVMIGFNDQSLTSIPDSAGASLYRKRGDYHSSSWSERVSDEIAAEYQITKLTEWPMTEIGMHCVVYRVPKYKSVAEVLAQLSQDSRVDIAQPMNIFKTQAQLNADPYMKLQTNLHTMQISQAHTQATGRKISIAMIDTGVALDHPDLNGQISHSQNFAHDYSPAFLQDKHGTAVAGIMVAKKDNATGITGVAPDAKLLAYKACWPDKADDMGAICSSYTLAMALNTALKSDAKVLNMSLSGPEDKILTVLLKKAIQKGMFVVAAKPGRGHEQDSFPASLADVIAVTSTVKHQQHDVAATAGISAPGEKVLTTLPEGRYDFISGSSIAAAEVSGVLALLLELKSDLTLAELRTLLDKASVDKTNEFAGINARLAVLALCEQISCPKNIALARFDSVPWH